MENACLLDLFKCVVCSSFSSVALQRLSPALEMDPLSPGDLGMPMTPELDELRELLQTLCPISLPNVFFLSYLECQ